MKEKKEIQLPGHVNAKGYSLNGNNIRYGKSVNIYKQNKINTSRDLQIQLP